jgi:type II secretory pathway pseudopilin PulG
VQDSALVRISGSQGAASQRGVSLTLLAVVLLAIVAAIVAFTLLSRGRNDAQREADTRQRFARVDAALISFVSLNQRLPCPADPSQDTGLEVPVGGSATCTLPGFPAGTLPWSTLGMSRDDAFDSWGWKISYRVYTGNFGSLTQAKGASMVNCDTAETAQTAVTALDGNSGGGLCQATFDTPPASYLANKGLTINDFGTLHADAAYVLVSHGPSGLGAYTSTGTRKTLPTSANELANTQVTGPFVAAAASTGLAPDDVNHFDDVLDYVSLSDLITRANVVARDWPDVTPGKTMNNATLAATLGHAVSVGDLGTNSITFGSGVDRARVRGFQSGSNTDISFNTTGGADSVGVAGAGNNLLSSANSDKLRIDFQLDVFKFAVALADFGTSGGDTERVQFVFSRGTGPGATTKTVVKSGCRADGGVATFSIDPGTDFERVEISPLTATPSGVTQFGVADFQVCGSSPVTCVSALATPSTACP